MQVLGDVPVRAELSERPREAHRVPHLHACLKELLRRDKRVTERLEVRPKERPVRQLRPRP